MNHSRNCSWPILLTLLAGCGFQPLYATPGSVPASLTAIQVETPSTRTGQLLREELDDELPRDAGSPARYRLVLKLDERRFPRGLRVDDTANRYEFRLTISYQLFEADTRRSLLTGARPVSVTYDVADAPYAGIAANLDGQERAASEAARIVRTDLARYFARLEAAPRPVPRR